MALHPLAKLMRHLNPSILPQLTGMPMQLSSVFPLAITKSG